ncbi:MAG: hypothetical protein IJ729_02305 [Alloprevotella sp.]|nr:hypothetical protein [Alloprevotella sp.]
MEPTIDKAHNPFRVPEGYFDTFTGRMMARIDAEAAVQPAGRRGLRLGRLVRSYTRYAAAVAAILAFFFVLTRTGVAEQSAASQPAAVGSQFFAQSDDDELYEYMLMNEMNIYDYEAYSY